LRHDVQHFENTLGDSARCRRTAKSGSDDGELVAAHPRDHLLRIEHTADLLSNELKQFVARGMSEQIVDFFEMIEVEAQ
jgi:hypothetical protein